MAEQDGHVSSSPDLSKSPADFPKYDREIILESLLNPNYAKERQDAIKNLEDLIANDFNVEEAQRVLKLVKATPPGPVLDPSEPRGLSERVYCRIEVLKLMLERGVGDGYEATAKAVLDAYRQGKLEVEAGKVSYWKGGILKRGLGEPLGEDLVKVFTKWHEEGPPGPVWEESADQCWEMAETATFPPHNAFHQHRYDVEIRLINGVSTVTVNVLDDTGFSYLSLRDIDLPNLGYNNNYAFRLTPVTCKTANGDVQRERLEVQVRLHSPSGANVGNFVRTTAVIHRGVTGGSPLSGMFVRQSLFTGTSPHGNGNLVVSTKKYAMAEKLPAR